MLVLEPFMVMVLRQSVPLLRDICTSLSESLLEPCLEYLGEYRTIWLSESGEGDLSGEGDSDGDLSEDWDGEDDLSGDGDGDSLPLSVTGKQEERLANGIQRDTR